MRTARRYEVVPMPATRPRASMPRRPLIGRPARVIGLLLGVVALSAHDLIKTLGHLACNTMIEDNPIARWLIEHGPPGGLIAWKLLTVSAFVGLLLRIRTARSAELGALVGMGIMAALVVQWARYDAVVADATRCFGVVAVATNTTALSPRAADAPPRSVRTERPARAPRHDHPPAPGAGFSD